MPFQHAGCGGFVRHYTLLTFIDKRIDYKFEKYIPMHTNKNCCDLNGSVVLFLNMIKLKELDSLGLYHITYLQTENFKKKLKALIIPYKERMKRFTERNRQYNQGIEI